MAAEQWSPGVGQSFGQSTVGTELESAGLSGLTSASELQEQTVLQSMERVHGTAVPEGTGVERGGWNGKHKEGVAWQEQDREEKET